MYSRNRKNKPIYVYLSIYDVHNLDGFNKKVRAVISENQYYHVFIKVKFSREVFRMCGRQFAFKLSLQQNILDLSQIISARISDFYNSYQVAEPDIVYIQLSFKEVDSKLLAEFSLDKDNADYQLISKPVNKAVEDLSVIPRTISETTLDNYLKTSLDVVGNISHIHLVKGGVPVNFLDIIREKASVLGIKHPEHIISFDGYFRFYYIKYPKSDYVLAVKELDNFSIHKLRYTLDGILLSQLTDRLIGPNTVYRKLGNNELIIKNNKSVEMKQSLTLRPLEGRKSAARHIDNPNIGVIDLETYMDPDTSSSKVYALGFKTPNDIKTYYVDSTINSDAIVLKLLDELLRPKHSKTTFYCHNLGGFDVFYILKVLTIFNEGVESKDDEYKLNWVFRDSTVLKLTISKDVDGHKRTLTICDSLARLDKSLDKLAKSFNVETQKGVFPHKFSTKANLFYVGDTPSIFYYNDMTDKKYKELDLFKTNWSFKQTALIFLLLTKYISIFVKKLLIA